MIEIWKDIDGYEGLYQVSNVGNVRSLNWRRLGLIRNLYLKSHNKGYLQVELHKGSERKTFTVHRLVAMHFVDGYEEGKIVNHKNEIRTDNRAENLEWCSHRENCIYGTARDRASKNCKKPIEQVDESGKVVRIWAGAIDAESEGFSRKTISACCLGKVKSHKGYKWRYAI